MSVSLALGESQSDHAGFHIFLWPPLIGKSVIGIMARFTDKDLLPHVTIFAESGPLAGDVAACLSGRFRIERATDRSAVARSLAQGCRALLIMGWSQTDIGTMETALIRQALAAGCRVLVLGAGGLHLGQELDVAIVQLPALPSPQQLLDNLSGLEPGSMTAFS